MPRGREHSSFQPPRSGKFLVRAWCVSQRVAARIHRQERDEPGSRPSRSGREPRRRDFDFHPPASPPKEPSLQRNLFDSLAIAPTVVPAHRATCQRLQPWPTSVRADIQRCPQGDEPISATRPAPASQRGAMNSRPGTGAAPAQHGRSIQRCCFIDPPGTATQTDPAALR